MSKIFIENFIKKSLDEIEKELLKSLKEFSSTTVFTPYDIDFEVKLINKRDGHVLIADAQYDHKKIEVNVNLYNPGE